ncbi:MAG: autorepressor SdpR family transcription factor [candidate division Zixibacteria bacterium]|nr:autorepressor SdpR family transcription factor [candidate division Zixibacteria bacterium]
MSELFKAFSDPTRREILDLLKGKDMSPSEILEKIDIAQPTLSHHLDILKRANLITGEREGQFIKYSLNMSVFQMAIEYMTKFIKRR